MIRAIFGFFKFLVVLSLIGHLTSGDTWRCGSRPLSNERSHEFDYVVEELGYPKDYFKKSIPPASPVEEPAIAPTKTYNARVLDVQVDPDDAGQVLLHWEFNQHKWYCITKISNLTLREVANTSEYIYAPEYSDPTYIIIEGSFDNPIMKKLRDIKSGLGVKEAPTRTLAVSGKRQILADPAPSSPPSRKNQKCTDLLRDEVDVTLTKVSILEKDATAKFWITIHGIKSVCTTHLQVVRSIINRSIPLRILKIMYDPGNSSLVEGVIVEGNFDAPLFQKINDAKKLAFSRGQIKL